MLFFCYLRIMGRDKTQRKELIDAGWTLLHAREDDIIIKRTRNAKLEKITKFQKN